LAAELGRNLSSVIGSFLGGGEDGSGVFVGHDHDWRLGWQLAVGSCGLDVGELQNDSLLDVGSSSARAAHGRLHDRCT
jgi:hypothetical protein